MKKTTASPLRALRDGTLRCVLYLCAGFTFLLLVALIGYIFYRGLGHITWQLLSTKPSYLSDTIGILPNIMNTIYIIFATLAIVLPLGVGGAVYLTEYAKSHRLVSAIEFAAETLTGIPSILYGLVGMLFFSQFCGLGTSLLAGALTLVIMILPTIVRTTQESLKTVPASYREGALALGSGKWHMVRTVVLPCAVDGIISGCILSVGRIVGESAALLYTAGLAHSLSGFVQAMGTPGATLTVALYVYVTERGAVEVGFAIASILMIITLLINFAATAVGKKLKNRH